MTSLTPLALKRRTNARIAASNANLKSMEQRSHNRCIQIYSDELFENLLELETNTKMNPDLIKSQPQITIEMRSILFDFLMDVHNRLKLSNTTFYLAINIVDRYCSLRIVRKDHFQLLGLTALWLASKFTDPKNKIPNIEFLRATCCNCYAKSLFIEMESHILKSLNWEIGSAGHDSFIDLILRDKFIDKFKIETINNIRYGSNYLCQLMQLYHRITFNYSVSQIALASVLVLACSSKLSVDGNLTHFLSYNEDFKINKLISMMLTILRNEPLPNSFKSRYFNSNNDLKLNPILYNIYRYSNELNRSNSPKTPLSSPLNSASSSPASRNTTNKFSLLTPPTSGSASPVNENYIYQKPYKSCEKNSTKIYHDDVKNDNLNENRKRSLEI